MARCRIDAESCMPRIAMHRWIDYCWHPYVLDLNSVWTIPRLSGGWGGGTLAHASDQGLTQNSTYVSCVGKDTFKMYSVTEYMLKNVICNVFWYLDYFHIELHFIEGMQQSNPAY